MDALTLLAQGVDPISGVGGWASAGLLGSVLAWVFFRNLPDKDKQIRALIDDIKQLAKDKDDQSSKLFLAYTEEREKDRTLRHDSNNLFQRALAEQAMANLQANREMVTSSAILIKEEREKCEQNHKEAMDANTKLIESIDRRFDEMSKHLENNFDVLRTIKHEIANRVQIEANDRAMKEHQQRRREPKTDAGGVAP